MTSEDGIPEELRIVLVGDPGSGKSATGNTILRKEAFTIGHHPGVPETLTCQTERGEFEGTPVSVVDTPWSIRPNTTEMSKCISYCVPGPHAFLLVIPVYQYTDVERHVKFLQWLFGEEASRYTIVLFTHGDKLPDRVTTEQFIRQNPLPYGVGYHIFNNNIEDAFQVRELLEKMKRMVQMNGGNYCIKVKDWKQKYLYPFAGAVTIGCGIGAASGGTGGGVLMAVIGSAVGVIAGRFVKVAVAVAAAVAVVFAVAGAGVVAVAGYQGFVLAVDLALGGLAAVHIARAGAKAVIVAVVAVITTLVAADKALAVGVIAFVAVVVVVAVAVVIFVPVPAAFVAAGGAAFIAAAGARAGAAAVGLEDALRAGAVTGAGIAAVAASAMFIGAREVTAFGVFHDIHEYVELFRIIGGAGVGAGVSAAVEVYADGHAVAADFDLFYAGFAVFMGGIIVLFALAVIVREAASTNDKIVGFAIVAGVSTVAAFGATAGYCWHNNTLRPLAYWLLEKMTSSSSSNMTVS